MKKAVQQATYDIVEKVSKELNYTLIDVKYQRAHGGMELAITIDKPGGISLDDCEKLSKALDQPLEEHDVSSGAPYNLTVSSYGLNRTLKTDYDFNRFLEKEITIKFYQPFNKHKEIICVLKNYNKPNITVEWESKIFEIALKDTANIKPYIKF